MRGVETITVSIHACEGICGVQITIHSFWCRESQRSQNSSTSSMFVEEGIWQDWLGTCSTCELNGQAWKPSGWTLCRQESNDCTSNGLSIWGANNIDQSDISTSNVLLRKTHGRYYMGLRFGRDTEMTTMPVNARNMYWMASWHFLSLCKSSVV